MTRSNADCRRRVAQSEQAISSSSDFHQPTGVVRLSKIAQSVGLRHAKSDVWLWSVAKTCASWRRTLWVMRTIDMEDRQERLVVYLDMNVWVSIVRGSSQDDQKWTVVRSGFEATTLS